MREPETVDQGWIQFGARIQGLTTFELQSLFAETSREHRAQPTAESSIRMAIILATPGFPDQDLERATALLDSSESDEVGDDPMENAAFIRFFRPLVRQLADQRTALSAETAEKQSLRNQLDALRDLEEELNVDDAVR